MGKTLLRALYERVAVHVSRCGGHFGRYYTPRPDCFRPTLVVVTVEVVVYSSGPPP